MELTADEGVYTLAFMMAMADGHIDEAESRAIADRLAAHHAPLPRQRCVELIYAARESYNEPNVLLGHIAAAIPAAERVAAIRVALEVLWADDAVDPTEMTAVHEFCDALDVDRRVLSGLLDEHR